MPKMKATKSAKPAAAGKSPKPPKRYRQFIERYPALGRAWESVNEAGAEGPLDARTRRLVKIAAAMGAMREGAVRSGARKALAEGVTLVEIEQLVPLTAGTIGLPSAVACWSWLIDALERE
jgi:alkylhydroperoxidase/carboxymuconolactone decarboxylase family protein YurZ